jgi:hypothetical protein
MLVAFLMAGVYNKLVKGGADDFVVDSDIARDPYFWLFTSLGLLIGMGLLPVWNAYIDSHYRSPALFHGPFVIRS